MHAWLCTNPTGVDALAWTELPTPTPKAGEVLIEIKAASLNFPDLLIVQNKYQMKPPLPFVPGSEYAGVVAAGGVGTAAIQIAKAMGARVIAAASSDEKCALCTSIGADATINYSNDNLRDAIKALTDGKGPDVIYDPVGGDFAEPAFRSIAWRGRYLVVGFASGPIPALPFNLALLKGASIVGVFWGDFAKREPKANAAMMGELAQWYAQGKIKPVIDRTMPMAELPAAYAHMGSRGVMGKLVMVN